MAEHNPYDSPLADLDDGRAAPRDALTVRRCATIVVGFALSFAVGGTAIGGTIGLVAPGYYRLVFRVANDPGFDPIRSGTALGAIQGLLIGIAIGAVVILAVAISKRGGQ